MYYTTKPEVKLREEGFNREKPGSWKAKGEGRGRRGMGEKGTGTRVQRSKICEK